MNKSLPLRSVEFVDDSDGVDTVEGPVGDGLPDANLPRGSLDRGCNKPLMDVASVLLFCWRCC
jgi:hypothetical protein